MLRSQPPTCQPFAAKRRAVAAPMPLPHPVMKIACGSYASLEFLLLPYGVPRVLRSGRADPASRITELPNRRRLPCTQVEADRGRLTKTTRSEGGNCADFPAAALLPLAVPVALSSSIAVAAPGAKGAEQVRVIVAYKDGQRGNAERALAMAGAEVHYDFAALRGLCRQRCRPSPSMACRATRRSSTSRKTPSGTRWPRPASLRHRHGSGRPVVGQRRLATRWSASSTPASTSATPITRIDLKSKMHGEYDSGTAQLVHGRESSRHARRRARSPRSITRWEWSASAERPTQPLYRQGLRRDGWAYSSSLVCAQSLHHKCVARREPRQEPRRQHEPRRLGQEPVRGDGLQQRLHQEQRAVDRGGRQRRQHPRSATRRLCGVVSGRGRGRAKAKASFSQYNADVELAAPGVGVLSTVPPAPAPSASVTVGSDGDTRRTALDGSPHASVQQRRHGRLRLGDIRLRRRDRQGLPDPARHVTFLRQGAQLPGRRRCRLRSSTTTRRAHCSAR